MIYVKILDIIFFSIGIILVIKELRILVIHLAGATSKEIHFTYKMKAMWYMLYNF